MRPIHITTLLVLITTAAFAAEKSPDNELPPHITHVTSFGERADWSHDGKRILFLSKTFGDWMETKQLGFSDARIAELTHKKAEDVTKQRLKAGVRHVWMDLSHAAVTKQRGASSAVFVLVASLALTVILGAKLFGLY